MVALFLLGAGSAAATENSILRLQAGPGPNAREGTCFVVHQEQRGEDRVVVFMTSAQLFAGLQERRARIFVSDSETIDLAESQIVLDPVRGIALLRAVVTHGAWKSVPVVFEGAGTGSVFIISGFNRPAGSVVTEHVSAVGESQVVGDRPADLPGCLGAPAIAADGAFGVVSECAPDRAPVVALFSAARSQIVDAVPALGSAMAQGPQFRISEREIQGPLVQLPNGEVRKGEVDIPFNLAAGETAIGASARVVTRTPLHVADVKVLSLKDRSVTLRFTLGGTPPAAAAGSSLWPHANALIMVHLNVLVLSPP